MTPLDAKFPAIATRLLAKHGITADYRRLSRVYDDLTGDEVQQASEFPVKILAPTTSKESTAGQGVASGSAVTYAAAQSFKTPPLAGDEIEINCVTWKIHNAITIRSGDLAALYQLEIITQ